MLLGPTGFNFERFVARILNEYGYRTRTDVLVKGRFATQEVDVIAVKGKIIAMVFNKAARPVQGYHPFPNFISLLCAPAPLRENQKDNPHRSA